MKNSSYTPKSLPRCRCCCCLLTLAAVVSGPAGQAEALSRPPVAGCSAAEAGLLAARPERPRRTLCTKNSSEKPAPEVPFPRAHHRSNPIHQRSSGRKRPDRAHGLGWDRPVTHTGHLHPAALHPPPRFVCLSIAPLWLLALSTVFLHPREATLVSSLGMRRCSLTAAPQQQRVAGADREDALLLCLRDTRAHPSGRDPQPPCARCAGFSAPRPVPVHLITCVRGCGGWDCPD